MINEGIEGGAFRETPVRLRRACLFVPAARALGVLLLALQMLAAQPASAGTRFAMTTYTGDPLPAACAFAITAVDPSEGTFTIEDPDNVWSGASGADPGTAFNVVGTKGSDATYATGDDGTYTLNSTSHSDKLTTITVNQNFLNDLTANGWVTVTDQTSFMTTTPPPECVFSTRDVVTVSPGPGLQGLAACKVTPGNLTASGSYSNSEPFGVPGPWDPANLQYAADCQTGLAPIEGWSAIVTAVVFLGTYDVNNEEKPLFAVGDKGGNVYLVSLNVDSNGQIQAFSAVDPYPALSFSEYGAVTALAVDPVENSSGIKHLYVSYANNDLYYQTYSEDYRLSPASLQVVRIEEGPSLVVAEYIGNFFWNNWSCDLDEKCDGTQLAFVNPNLSTYPPNYPGLPDSAGYESTGAVLYSGIIGSLYEGDESFFTGDEAVPVNTGYLCSAGTCTVAYNITLTAPKSFSVMTAAEFGQDGGGTEDVRTVLYWNQVEGAYYQGPPKESAIADNTSNTVASCELSQPVPSDMVVGGSTAACKDLSQLESVVSFCGSDPCPPFVTQLSYLPVPESLKATNSIGTEVGALILAYGGPGYTGDPYLFYHPLLGNEGQDQLFSGDASGLGVQPMGLSPDPNSNLFVQVGAQGLLGFNVFAPNYNPGAGSDTVTLIANSSDPDPSDCGTKCSIITAVGLISDTITILGSSDPGVTLVERPEYATARVEDPARGQIEVLREDQTQPTPVLQGLFGGLAYRAEFRYGEDDLAAMGLKKGQWLTGMKFRLANGQSKRPLTDVEIGDYLIVWEADDGWNARPAYQGPLRLPADSYRMDRKDGYGPEIRLRPFKYEGGPLWLLIRQEGSGASDPLFPLYVEAAGGEETVGAYEYEELAAGAEDADQVGVLKVAPVLKLSTGRRKKPGRPRTRRR